MLITAAFNREHRACYTDVDLALLYPRGRTLEEVLTLTEGKWSGVSSADRVWVALRPGVLTKDQMWAFLIRLIRRQLGRIDVPSSRLLEAVEALETDTVTRVIEHNLLTITDLYASWPSASQAATARIILKAHEWKKGLWLKAFAAANDASQGAHYDAEREQQVQDLLDIIRKDKLNTITSYLDQPTDLVRKCESYEDQLVRISQFIKRDATKAPEHDRTIAGAVIDEIKRLTEEKTELLDSLSTLVRHLTDGTVMVGIVAGLNLDKSLAKARELIKKGGA